MGHIISSNKQGLKDEQLNELINVTCFQKKELKQQYKDFMAKNPTGQIDQATFRQYYRNLTRTKESSQIIDMIFKTFDNNNDGTIDFRELMCAHSVTRPGSSDQRLKWIFKVYDQNGDRFITRDEMLNVFSVVGKLLGGNDALGQRVDKIFQDMDINKDRRLGLEEFVAGCKQDQTLIMAFENLEMSKWGNTSKQLKSNG